MFFVGTPILPSVLISVGSPTSPSVRRFRRQWALGADSVMDEFDIFMDAMSRNAAMKQILVFANKHCHRQFILITPQVSSPPNPTPYFYPAGGIFLHG